MSRDLLRMPQGTAIQWLYEPRYGYTYWVKGRVVRAGVKRIQIAVQKTSGEEVQRWVSPSRLRVLDAGS